MPAMAKMSLAIPLVFGAQIVWAAVRPNYTCGDMKSTYKAGECCGAPEKQLEVQVVPNPTKRMTGTNPCAGKKLSATVPALNNKDCWKTDGVRNAIEQAGGDVSEGYQGTLNSSVIPIKTHYYKTALCPVNVHWHLGAEHRSAGQFDEEGTSPENGLAPEDENPEDARRLAAARYGYACRHYKKDDARFNTNYTWKYCQGMHVGETYEVHWPHSALGACGTPYQYQDPFYDGVFCHATAEAVGKLSQQDIASNVGVQGQVFTIINDEDYYYPELIRGMIVDAEKFMGTNITAYTGSTTGTSRNNKVCSAYAPITWQVDRVCHLISASSFDKMCADMLQMRDDMSGDIHPHGARELVWKNLTANNQADFLAPVAS